MAGRYEQKRPPFQPHDCWFKARITVVFDTWQRVAMSRKVIPSVRSSRIFAAETEIRGRANRLPFARALRRPAPNALDDDGAGAAMHCFRRFRAAVLKKQGCPDDLRRFWLGHENHDISDEYAEQLLEDVERRQQVAASVGLGFELPEASCVPNVPQMPELEEVEIAA